jgi:hypothetical protein
MGDPNPDLEDPFLTAAAHSRQTGLARELLAFLRDQKAWWLAPILLVLALFAVLLALGASGVAPFLYPF